MMVKRSLLRKTASPLTPLAVVIPEKWNIVA
jgi:hypothetical protein